VNAFKAPAPIAPGDTIGILGSGQLGRMLALAAARLGIKVHIFCPESGPAFDVVAAKTRADYSDEAALSEFAENVRLVTYEFENVPQKTAEFLARKLPVHPNPQALATSQDRFVEKSFLNRLGIATAPFSAVENLGDLEKAVQKLGVPAILKTRRFGYDGKGQAMIRPGDDLAEALRSIGAAPAILEGFVPFAREVSVIAARAADGSFAAFDVNENVHANQILSLTTVPAQISAATVAAAVATTAKIVDALDYIGIIAVEMFIVGEGATETIVVNEIAPRVHNSGHWTIDGAVTSQFEQHIRAICGFPLGSTKRHGRVEMRNLIGDDVLAWRALMQEPGASVHLYGKHDARDGRKMGHVTRLLG
jgi:5-(carboxyamino)imidazole ribonucleotide synthase